MKTFARRLIIGMVVFASVAFVGNMVYRKYVTWRFGEYVVDYSKNADRRAAYAAFELAKPHLNDDDEKFYEKRLAKLEDKFQYPLWAAIHTLSSSDSGFQRPRDRFEEVLLDLSRVFEREESPGKEIWDLCLAEMEVSGIAWPFILEDLGFERADGSERTISYEEYLTWKKKFAPAEQRMEALLAASK